jgi:hypothetical protein
MKLKAEEYIVFPNSPIEFAISGPSGGRDRILIKSSNAGLDLIGLAAQSDLEYHRRSSSPDLINFMFGETRQLNLVASFPLEDINPDEDSRSSRFRFAWRGYASQTGMDHVKRAFDLQFPELHRAIRSRDLQEIEWALSPLIYQCSEANERRIRSRRAMLVAFGFYLFTGIVALLVFAVFGAVKH